MNQYFVIWTYVANYGVTKMEGETPEAVANVFIHGFSADFRERGKVYVFDKEPVFIYNKGGKDYREHLSTPK